MRADKIDFARSLFELTEKEPQAEAEGRRIAAEYLPPALLREELPLPSLSEPTFARHYTALSKRNFGVDTGFYPLGSCTMKYNPKLPERVSGLEGFAGLHPLSNLRGAQGALRLMWELERDLAEITGLPAFSLQPCAGAHGEATGLWIIRAYHQLRGELERTEILVPDTAHGTNPASTTRAGFTSKPLRSGLDGRIDLAELKQALGPKTAALMLTNPNTLGLFETEIVEICRLVHSAGGLAYYDGANLNAILGYTRPGDMGFDLCHLNLHKTFGTPHGGGGPGSGPVGVTKELERFLPVPRIRKEGERFDLDWEAPDSVGKVQAFFGNFLVLVKAYVYLRLLGAEGLQRVSEQAVLNANYLLQAVEKLLPVPYGKRCMHEFVASAKSLKEETGCGAREIGKRLLDFGFHSPTIYFPHLVHEALMFEPTETERVETLDAFVEALAQILEEARTNPEFVKTAPHNTPVKRVNEVQAARQPRLTWDMD